MIEGWKCLIRPLFLITKGMGKVSIRDMGLKRAENSEMAGIGRSIPTFRGATTADVFEPGLVV
jgi:hypothetical protein